MFLTDRLYAIKGFGAAKPPQDLLFPASCGGSQPPQLAGKIGFWRACSPPSFPRGGDCVSPVIDRCPQLAVARRQPLRPALEYSIDNGDCGMFLWLLRQHLNALGIQERNLNIGLPNAGDGL